MEIEERGVVNVRVVDVSWPGDCQHELAAIVAGRGVSPVTSSSIFLRSSSSLGATYLAKTS